MRTPRNCVTPCEKDKSAKYNLADTVENTSVWWGKMNEQQKVFTRQADLLLTVLNQQRHDWLNHIQVLLCLLQLGRVEEGTAYLRRITEKTHLESGIARINSPLLSVFFLTFNALHSKLQLEAEADHKVNLARLRVDANDLFHFVSDLVFAVMKHVREDLAEPASLLVSFQAAKETAVQLRFDLAEGLPQSAKPDIQQIIGRVNGLGASVITSIHSEAEWVAEFLFPCQT
jgi:stage 0 sporulation protein B (sporulation initiation phosphotransferase)